MDDLKNKLSQVKDEHAAEIVDQKGREIEEKRVAETMFFLGRVKQIGHDARAVATALSAQEIRALEHFQEERMYIPLGYTTFVDFLDKSEYSPMSKRQYYERRELMNAHGDEIYDLLTSVGISVRASKMLGKGDLVIKGDKLVAGDTEIEIANSSVIKEVLEEMIDEKRQLQEQVAKAENKAAKLTDQVDRGSQDLEQLQRALDEATSGDPFDRDYANAIHALLVLQEATGQLDDAAKAERGGSVSRELFRQVQLVSRAFGFTGALEDVTQTTAATPIDDTVSRVLADDDDFGDQDEV